MLLIVRFAVPVLVNVTLMGIEVVPLDRVGNVRDEGESDTVGAPAVPARLSVVVSPLVRSVTVSVSLTAPSPCGAKATLRVQSCVVLAGQVEPPGRVKLLDACKATVMGCPRGLE